MTPSHHPTTPPRDVERRVISGTPYLHSILVLKFDVSKILLYVMVNSVNPDQMLHSVASNPGSTLFAKAYLSKYLGLVWYFQLFHKCMF